jgi:glycosyltransferase involved in cell wall biosynthesis
LYEPWGLVYLEAMACGMPIVGFARNAFPEFVCDDAHGYTLPADQDAASLADLILHMKSHPEELAEKGERARQYCMKNFNWDLAAGRILEVIQSQL